MAAHMVKTPCNGEPCGFASNRLTANSAEPRGESAPSNVPNVQ